VWLEAAWLGDDGIPRPDARRCACAASAAWSAALDNTWGAGLAFNAFDLDGAGLGVDISAHALTKYPSGGGDVLMGSITTRDEALHLKIKLTHMRLGTGRGRQRCRGRAARAAQHRPALSRARPGGAGAGALVSHAAAIGAGAASRLARRIAGHAHWQTQLCGAQADARGDGAAAGLFSVMVDAALHAGAGRRLL
jgi:cystathionine beta-lyase